MNDIKLNAAHLRLISKDNSMHVFDIVRKKFVVCTPEEYVRQLLIDFLVEVKKYPLSLIAVEHTFQLKNTQKRADIVLFDTALKPRMVVECKSPEVPLSEKVFDQAVRYNMVLQADYLLVSNGDNHFCCKLDHANQTYVKTDSVPAYSDII